MFISNSRKYAHFSNYIMLYLKLKFLDCLDQGSANLAHGPNLIHHLFLYSLQAKNAFPPSILMSERQKRKKIRFVKYENYIKLKFQYSFSFVEKYRHDHSFMFFLLHCKNRIEQLLESLHACNAYLLSSPFIILTFHRIFC